MVFEASTMAELTGTGIPRVKIKHCFKEANQCADRLAAAIDFMLFDVPPSYIMFLLYFDCMGRFSENLPYFLLVVLI
ncbi:hypothetical protein ACB092_05G094700 [Castanea dentata]